MGARQNVEAYLAGQVSSVKLQIATASGDRMTGMESTETASEHLFRTVVVPSEERFRISIREPMLAGGPSSERIRICFAP